MRRRAKFLLRRAVLCGFLIAVVGNESMLRSAELPVASAEPDFQSKQASASDPLVALTSVLQSKLVKIYGAGGLQGLESYQSGFLVSDAGHVVTSWSTVLDVNAIRVVTMDGRKDDAEIVGMDPETEIAVLKMSRSDPNFFSMNELDEPIVGNRVFGLSNLFGIATGDEAMSISEV